MERLKFTEDLDDYFGGVLASIRSSYSTSDEADREEAKIREALGHERVNVVFDDHLDETASRRSAAHLTAIGLQADRHDLRAVSPDVAEKIDRMIHHALKLAEHMVGMGGDPTVTMLKAMQNDYVKKGNADGGRTGSRTRVKWQEEARERYDRYRLKHPNATVRIRIAEAILKEGPILGAPSDDRVLEKVREWWSDEV